MVEFAARCGPMEVLSWGPCCGLELPRLGVGSGGLLFYKAFVRGLLNPGAVLSNLDQADNLDLLIRGFMQG